MADSIFNVRPRETADEHAVERKSHLPSPQVASRIAIGAGAAGLLGDLLFQDGPGGVGLTLYLVAIVGTLTVSARKRVGLSLESRILLWIAVLFAAVVAVRDSEILAVANVLAALTAISLAALTTTSN